MERKTTRLRRLIEQPGMLIMPGAYEPLGAKLIQQAGFDAIQCSGLGICGTVLGMPDYSLLAMSDMAIATARIADAVDIPVMADGDTGFGNAVNAWYAVRAFERVGAAGVNLEDQVMPKRCGHLDGKQLVSIEEAVAKIRAAADARLDKDFVINARTDALAVGGIDDVIQRGNAYLEAGATMIFMEGATSLDVISAAVKGIRGPVGVNIVTGGKSSDLDIEELAATGVARVSLPGLLLGAALKAMEDALRSVRETNSMRRVNDSMYPFKSIQSLLGMEEVTQLENSYLAELKTAGVGQ